MSMTSFRAAAYDLGIDVDKLKTMAGTGTAGMLLPAASVADATDADDIVEQFNALLASLRAAGVISAV